MEESGSFVIRYVAIGTFSLSQHTTTHSISQTACFFLLSLQRLYSPGWASASFKSFLRPSRFRSNIFQFLHPSLATSSSTPSSQRSLGLPLGRFPPDSLRRTLLDKSSSSWRMTCPAQGTSLSLTPTLRPVHQG